MLYILLDQSITFTTYQKWDIAVKVITPMATISAVFFAYKFAEKNMQKETAIRISRYKNDKLLDATIGFWKLLAYTTDSENEKSIITFKRDRQTQKDQFYLHKKNAEAFIKELLIRT